MAACTEFASILDKKRVTSSSLVRLDGLDLSSLAYAAAAQYMPSEQVVALDLVSRYQRQIVDKGFQEVAQHEFIEHFARLFPAENAVLLVVLVFVVLSKHQCQMQRIARTG